jgi:hypothetical protein
MRMLPDKPRPSIATLLTLALLIVDAPACTTAPRPAFTGNWASEIPRGPSISFTVQQNRSMVTGVASNCGPVMASVTGLVTGDRVSLRFDFSPSEAPGPPPPAAPVPLDSVVPWSFQGAFTSDTSVEGKAASVTGGGSMTIMRTGAKSVTYQSPGCY